jgi:hypothetical protein
MLVNHTDLGAATQPICAAVAKLAATTAPSLV